MKPQADAPLSLTRTVALYLRLVADTRASADRLHALYMRMPSGAQATAVWDGYWALKKQADTMAERLRAAGGLLFAASAKALAAARAMEHADWEAA